MNKHARFLVFGVCFVLVFSVVLQAQEIPPKKPLLSFKNLSFDFNGDGRWDFDEGFEIGEMRLWTTLALGDHLNVVAVGESRVGKNALWQNVGNRATELTQLYVQYGRQIPILPRGVSVLVKAGKLEWYPNYTDPRQIIENLDQYINPASMYGASLRMNAALNRSGTLMAFFGGHTGDLGNKDLKAEVLDAYVRYHPRFAKDLGARVQMGKSQGTEHFVNHAFLNYTPTIYKDVRFDIRVGKLIGLDRIPYGIRVGIEKPFKFIALGGYYERRLNQSRNEQFIGFYWRFLRPPKLVEFMNAFQFMYDTNTNSLIFNIPFISINFKN